MKRLVNFSYYRLLVIVLGVMLLLTSCKQLGLFSNFPNAEEIPSPGGFDPGMELVSDYLICPTIPNTAPVIPPGPYDEELGDCALRGKSAEIETWLTELEQIALSCQANREPNWAATLVAREYLDAKIDELVLFDFAPIRIEKFEEEDETGPSDSSEYKKPWFDIENCGPYKSAEDSESGQDHFQLHSHHYTDLLISISENVDGYCTMIDDLIKPIWQACDQININQYCQVRDREEYHSILELRMNDAQTNYDSIDLFYTNTLQTDGWDDFRSSYIAVSLGCPTDSHAPDTKFTFEQNAFCRKGPSSEYEEVATFLAGHVVQIEGRNHHEPRWWVIPNPGARGQCWVSDSTGAAEGPLEELVIVAAPPLVVNKPSDGQSTTKTCSKDLGASACTAAGGHMSSGSSSAPECVCP